MKHVFTAAVAALTMTASSAVMAADMGAVVMDEPTVMTDPGFDWDGMYFGLRGAGTQYVNGGDPSFAELSFVLGANGTVDNVLFGVEAWAGGYRIDSYSDIVLGAEGRLGYLVTPDIALYGSGTVESYLNADGPGFHLNVLGIGAGVEFALSDSLSADLGYTYFGWNNMIPDLVGHQVSASLNYHF